MKYRIVNRKRFVAFAAAVIVLIAVPIFGIINTVSAQTADAASSISIEVKHGDTLWSLAKEYGNPKDDIRNTVIAIERANAINPEDLHPGMEIIIPAEIR